MYSSFGPGWEEERKRGKKRKEKGEGALAFITGLHRAEDQNMSMNAVQVSHMGGRKPLT